MFKKIMYVMFISTLLVTSVLASDDVTTKKTYTTISSIDENGDKYKLYFNNDEVLSKNPILVKEDTMYVLINDFVDNIGGEVSYNDDGSITCEYNGIKLTYLEGKNNYKVDDKNKFLLKKPFSVGYDIYVPINSVVKNFNLYLYEKGSNIKITTNKLSEVDTTELDEFLKQYSGVSVYYENLDANYIYTYNPEEEYFMASVVKAPYCLYVYYLAEMGLADLSDVHTYTEDKYRDGTGVIQDMPFGTQFTENELLMYSIRYSDNVAFNMLLQKYGTEDFKRFVQALGGNPEYIRTVKGAYTNVYETAIFAKAIYYYIEGNYTYSEQFKTDLMSTRNRMIYADYPIARKYGWADEWFNDMAIVYSPSPYILIILTNHDGDFKIFKDISLKIQDFNEEYFVSQQY